MKYISRFYLGPPTWSLRSLLTHSLWSLYCAVSVEVLLVVARLIEVDCIMGELILQAKVKLSQKAERLKSRERRPKVDRLDCQWAL